MYMSDRLTKLAKAYHDEAGRCLRGKAYLAACVMQGAALESLLQAMCFLYPDAVKKTVVYQKRQKRGFQRKRNKALDFKYVELINIASELGWFPPKKVVVWGKRTNVAGFVQELRGLRNYVHPGVWSREQKPLKFTKGVFNVVFEIFEVANDWLLHHVHKSMLKKMERAEKAANKNSP
jgi:hypothetical protein